MDGERGARPPLVRLPVLVAGVFFVVAFFALDQTSNTIRVRFVPPWDRSSSGELYFWLAALLFLWPGTWLIGVSLTGIVTAPLARAHARLARFSPGERAIMWVTLTVIGWSFARLTNQMVLCGQPFTDDEDAARFGGQILSSGALWVPLPPMRFAFPELFLFQRAGGWTSFDFLGALLAWAFAELTGTDTLIFSLFACLLPLGVAVACARAEGCLVGLAAGLATFCSPMMASLSMTSHAHVVSRGLLAAGLGLLWLHPRPSVARALLAGGALGLAFATRPPEITMLLLPVSILCGLRVLREPALRPAALGVALAAAPIVLMVFAYNHAVSGSFAFLRGAPNEIRVPYAAMMHGPFAFERWWPRFGNNLSYNLITISIWFFGPIGALMAWLGVGRSRLHGALAVGLVLDLILALLHDDRGLHMVGPIHLSEMAVPLTILAASGGCRAVAMLQARGFSHAAWCAGLLGFALLGLPVFTSLHARALHGQALARVDLTERVESVRRRPAVVLAPPFATVRDSVTKFAQVGGFVCEWRRARPDVSDPVLVLHDSPRARLEVHAAFPERSVYVLDSLGALHELPPTEPTRAGS